MYRLVASRLDRHFASSRARASKEPIKERQKHVIAAVRNVVMAHVISTSEANSGRQPAVPVNTPMDLFRHNQVDNPTNEDTRENSPEAHPGSNQKCWNAVDNEQEKDVQWGTDECHVFCFLGSTNLRMVLVMSSS